MRRLTLTVVGPPAASAKIIGIATQQVASKATRSSQPNSSKRMAPNGATFHRLARGKPNADCQTNAFARSATSIDCALGAGASASQSQRPASARDFVIYARKEAHTKNAHAKQIKTACCASADSPAGGGGGSRLNLGPRSAFEFSSLGLQWFQLNLRRKVTANLAKIVLLQPQLPSSPLASGKARNCSFVNAFVCPMWANFGVDTGQFAT